MPNRHTDSRSDWRWILTSLRPHRERLAALAVLSLAEVGLRMLLPWPIKAVLDHVGIDAPLPATAATLLAPLMAPFAAAGARPIVARLGGIILAGVIVQLLHQAVLLGHTRLQAALGLRVVRDLRERLFDHVQALALIYHDRQPVGDAVYRLESDAGCIENLAFGAFFPFVFSVLTLVAMLVVLIVLDWRLAAAAMLIVPLLLVWMHWRTTRMAARAKAAREAESEMVSQAYESFSAIRLVKSFAQESHERRRFSRAAGAVMEARLRTSAQDAAFSLGVGALTTLGTAAVLGLGGYFLVTGSSTPGTLLLALSYLGFVYGPLSGIANTAGAMQQALASAARVHATMRLPREDVERRAAVDAPAFRGLVEYEDVSFAFDDGHHVLQHVSFTASPGQLIALVGPSGSGKTTLVSLMPRLREPGDGSVKIDGRDVREYRLGTLRRQIAVVLQDAVILSGSIADNLRYGRLDATDAEIEDAARLANAHDFIVSMRRGYATPLSEAGRTLSGGQRQRISIARAFLKNAPVVVFDEPTAALDTVSERAIVDALHRLREGRTTFVIAHRLSTVRDADCILVMQAGVVVASGRHQELLARSNLYQQLATSMVL